MNDIYKTITHGEILFAESFHVILFNLDLIIETPEYYNCRLPFFGFRQMFGLLGLRLGNLVQLWEGDQFTRKCDCCDYKIYIFYCQDMPNILNYWKGICPNCRQIKFGAISRDDHYHSLLRNIQLNYEHNGQFRDHGYIKGLELSELLKRINSSKYLNMN